jgi:hypothetical protein
MQAMEVDRRVFMASVGGVAAAELLSPEDRAEAIEHFASTELDNWYIDEFGETGALSPIRSPRYQQGGGGQQAPEGPRMARGTGRIFQPREEPWPEMPAKPTLVDFYRYRFAPAQHVMRSATRAIQTGQPERTVMACLLHDVAQAMCRSDHGYWGHALFAPYVDERVSWGVKYHQALRFFPDPAVGYEYPEFYNRIFGEDYVPDDYIKADYKFAREHKWYMESRLVTMNDEYGFDRSVSVSLEPFIDVIGRQFKQPKEGLGFDNSPSAHMWRTLINPARPL